MLTRISRILVGALFIVSGLIKANDPIGFSYKLNDYFAPGVFDLPWLDPFALELAVLACVAEIVLGVAILFGARMVLASWSLLLLMVFFTYLTGYTAVANWMFENYESGLTHFVEGLFGFVIREDYSYMKDCGCFGDAIKLDPWESFLKDVVLMVFTVIIFLQRKVIKPADTRTDLINLGVTMVLIAGFSLGMVHWAFPIWFSLVTFAVLLLIKTRMSTSSKDWIMAAAATVIATGFSIYCIQHLPIKDFRPFKVGNNIAELSECPEDAPKDVYKDTWIYKVNGVEGEYTTEQAPWNIEGAEFVDRHTELVFKGCEPPIHDFILEDADGVDMTEAVLEEEFVLLLVAYDLKKTDEEAMAELNEIYDASVAESGPYMFGLAANTTSELDAFSASNSVVLPWLTADATMLKTIIRSNPGLLLLQRGTVVGKWHGNDIPDYEDIKALMNGAQ